MIAVLQIHLHCWQEQNGVVSLLTLLQIVLYGLQAENNDIFANSLSQPAAVYQCYHYYYYYCYYYDLLLLLLLLLLLPLGAFKKGP